jgi:hypothetical protein
MSRKPKEFPTSGPALWAVRLFILPHTIVGVFLIGQVILALLWLICGDDSTGQITRAWTEQHKGTHYYIGYRYSIGPVKHSAQATIDSATYEQLPQSIRQPGTQAPGESPQTALVRLRVFSFARLEKVAPLPPYGSYPIKEFVTTAFVAVFWDGILSVFLYQAWIRPYRVHREKNFTLKPPARPIGRIA